MPSLPPSFPSHNADRADDFDDECRQQLDNDVYSAYRDIPSTIEPEMEEFEDYYANRAGDADSTMAGPDPAFGRRRQNRQRIWCPMILTAVLLTSLVGVATIIGKGSQMHQTWQGAERSPSSTSTTTKRPPLEDSREPISRPVSPPVTVTGAAAPPAPTAFPSTENDVPQSNDAVEPDLYQYLVSLVGPDALNGTSDRHSTTYAAYRWLSSDDSHGRYTPQQIRQRFALACLFFATNGGVTDVSGSSWKHTKGWMSHTEECHWHGLHCRGDVIIRLNLTENGLQGLIPSEVSLLSDSLLLLDLSGNDITNAFDELSFLGDFTKLKVLKIQDTFFASHGVPMYISMLTALGKLFSNVVYSILLEDANR
jgi:hypothetical protein